MYGRVRPLTPIQQQVLQCVAEGCATKEIAALLGMSTTGVKKHLEKLRYRYGVTNRVALLVAAIEAGDVRLGDAKRTEPE